MKAEHMLNEGWCEGCKQDVKECLKDNVCKGGKEDFAAMINLDVIKLSKADFVKMYISPLLEHANININQAIYVKPGVHYPEEVQIFYNSGYIAYVNVSCDSHIAMARDVLKRIED